MDDRVDAQMNDRVKGKMREEMNERLAMLAFTSSES